MLGRLIVFDGNDGSGKQTQAKHLVNALRAKGERVMEISFPRYTETFFGQFLKEALKGDYGDFAKLHPRLASVFYALDRAASKGEILAELEKGGYVVCDRYKSANDIHQGGKIADPAKRVEFLEWLDALEYGELKIPRPDVSIYLDVPLEVSQANMTEKTRDIVEQDPWYLRNSHESAQWLIARDPNRWIHIRCAPDGVMRSREDIHDEVMGQLQSRHVFR